MNMFFVQLRSLLEWTCIFRFCGTVLGFIRSCDDRSRVLVGVTHIAGLLSALWMGPLGSGAIWGPISSPGPSPWWWTRVVGVLLSIERSLRIGRFFAITRTRRWMSMPIFPPEADCLSRAI